MQMPSETLTVRALGLATAAGPSVAATMERLASGDSLIMRHDAFMDSAYDNLSCIFAQTQTLVSYEERVLELIAASWADCFSQGIPADPVKILVLLPESDDLTGMPKPRVVAHSADIHRMVLDQSAAFGLQVEDVQFLNKGQAGLGMALQNALADGSCDYVIVGADTYCDRDRLSAASRAAQLFSSRDKWGFIPGEAGGCTWVSPLPHPDKTVTILAAQSDKEEIPERETELASDHGGLSRAVRATCEPLGDLRLSRWLSDMNNGRYRASELAYAVHRATAFWCAEDMDIVHIPATFGECGTAYGFLALLGAGNRQQGALTIASASSVLGMRSAFVVQS